jgi:hypothetical protein
LTFLRHHGAGLSAALRGHWVRRSWASAHKEAVTRYVRALASSFAFIRNPANRD